MGLTDEQIAEMDKIAGLSDDKFAEMDRIATNKSKGINLTPSGLLMDLPQKAGGAISSAINAPFRAAKDNIPLNEAYTKNYNEFKDFQEEQSKTPLGRAAHYTTDLYGYLAIPQTNVIKSTSWLPGVLKSADWIKRLGNYGINGATQGAIIGGLEGLKNEGVGGILPGVGQGAALGGAIGAGVPTAGNVALQAAKQLPKAGGLISRTVGRVQPETLQQAVKPDSKALDLSRNEAQNLLMDTTERIQNDYNSLLDSAGLDIQKAALNLPEERGVFTSSLKNSLNDIFNGSQVSNNKALNPAFNGNSDIYNKINGWIEKSSNPEKLTAPEMYDLMSNIKKNIPIDWEAPTAEARNALKQQIYGDYARRLGNLSPELRKANKVYADLMKFENNEGVRQILQPKHIGDLDNSSSKLRNYNSTVTKGNTNRNIQDLENLLVANEKKPFLNDIDDVNAAMDLLNIRGTGDSWLANMATQATRPVLKAIRWGNKKGLPELFAKYGKQIPPVLVPWSFSATNNYLSD